MSVLHVALNNTPCIPLSVGHREMFGLESAASADPGSAEERRQEPLSMPGRFQPPATGLLSAQQLMSEKL